jgi:Ca2+-binding RTX toxin-like protein
MALSSLQRLLKKSRPLPRSARRHTLALEALEGRTVLSFLPAFPVTVDPRAVTVTASFSAGTLRVVGSEQDDTIVVSRDAAGTILVNGGAVTIQGGPATVANTSLILLNGGAGSDSLVLDETCGALPLARLDGGSGNDVLVGGSAGDVIDGAGGDDMLSGGAGNDTFVWSPGDASDVVEGRGGSDTLVFGGSDLSEKFNLSASGNRVLFTRDIGNVTLDLSGIEAIELNAAGGADSITVGDLSGTDVSAVNLDLGPPTDGAADAVTVNGTDQNYTIDLRIAPLSVEGLHALVTLNNFVGATDSLTINAGGGDDTVVASSILAGAVKLTEDGGAGNDTLVGSRGNDTLIGGDGDDVILGFRGNDVALMGAGNDTFEWDQGDGSDTVEGQSGRDTMLFNAGNDAENFDLSASGDHVRFRRTLAGGATVTMDLDAVEQVDLSARGGADTIVVNDLSATGLTALNLDLDSALGEGTGDGAIDSVVVNGTDRDDAIQIAAFDNGARITGAGLLPLVNITGAEGANDTLTVNTLGGNDVVDASSLPAGLIGLSVNLGDGQGVVAKTSTTLSTSSATTVFGPPVALTATVTSAGGVPTGTVTFLDGTIVLGTVQVNAAGQAPLAVSLGVGRHTLTASFVATGGFTASMGVADVTVNRAATTTALLASANPAVVGRAVRFMARIRGPVGAGTPTGTVTFFVGKKVVARVTLDASGQARFTRSFSRSSRFSIRAAYSGDAHFATSSQSLTERVKR